MDKQKDKPLYVAFSTQKGGAGKTTLTVLMASYLHYVKGYDVAVIDCDFPQYSIYDMRKRDMGTIMKDTITRYRRMTCSDSFPTASGSARRWHPSERRCSAPRHSPQTRACCGEAMWTGSQTKYSTL